MMQLSAIELQLIFRFRNEQLTQLFFSIFIWLASFAASFIFSSHRASFNEGHSPLRNGRVGRSSSCWVHPRPDHCFQLLPLLRLSGYQFQFISIAFPMHRYYGTGWTGFLYQESLLSQTERVLSPVLSRWLFLQDAQSLRILFAVACDLVAVGHNLERERDRNSPLFEPCVVGSFDLLGS